VPKSKPIETLPIQYLHRVDGVTLGDEGSKHVFIARGGDKLQYES